MCYFDAFKFEPGKIQGHWLNVLCTIFITQYFFNLTLRNNQPILNIWEVMYIFWKKVQICIELEKNIIQTLFD